MRFRAATRTEYLNWRPLNFTFMRLGTVVQLVGISKQKRVAYRNDCILTYMKLYGTKSPLNRLRVILFGTIFSAGARPLR